MQGHAIHGGGHPKFANAIMDKTSIKGLRLNGGLIGCACIVGACEIR